MTRSTAKRIAGTAVLATGAAVPFAMGLWATWVFLFRGMPMPFGVIAMAGAVTAPFLLVRDIIVADREDQKAKLNKTKDGEPFEALD